MVLEKIFKDLAIFHGFSLLVRKILETMRTNFKEANPRYIPAKN
jgi:hypothetical protein